MFEARLNALVASEEAEGKAPFAFEVDYGERAEHCWNGKAPRCCWHLRCFLPKESSILVAQRVPMHLRCFLSPRASNK